MAEGTGDEPRKRKGKEKAVEGRETPSFEPKRKAPKQDTYMGRLHEMLRQERFQEARQEIDRIGREGMLCIDLERAQAIVRVHQHARQGRWKQGLGIHGTDRRVDAKLVKEKYRSIALLLHPDKSSLPKSEEAFVLVGECCEKLLEEGGEPWDALGEDREQVEEELEECEECALSESQFASICNSLGVHPLVQATEATLAAAIVELQRRVLQCCAEMVDRESAVQMNHALRKIRNVLARRKKKTVTNTFKATGGFM